VVADFNRDGKLDLAVLGSSGTILILLGNGDGIFTAPNSPSAGKDPAAFVVADFIGDGIPDLAVLESGYSGPDSQLSAIILLGNGDGTFSAQATTVTTPPANPYYSGAAMVAGDFNGDGKADLAILSDHVNIFLGNGNGTFTTAANLTTGSSPMSLAVGDFNGDGTLDLAVTNTIAHGGVANWPGRWGLQRRWLFRYRRRECGKRPGYNPAGPGPDAPRQHNRGHRAPVLRTAPG
jgi:hypothetical protein